MISKRLKLICDFVEKDSIVADIGTDHGLIPLYLSKNNISKKVIATDISKNSLSKLENILESNSFINCIDIRVSDGLNGLNEFEVDTIIISGMGGILISEILKSSINIAKSANRIILSPNNSLYHLRENTYYQIILKY